MENKKKSIKQIDPNIEVKGKFQEAIKSPLNEISSKKEVLKQALSEEE